VRTSALADVRSSKGSKCKIPPRGIPDKIGDVVLENYYQYVFDNEDERFDEDNVSREQADEWVRKGLSHYENSFSKKNGLVSEPDWHSSSYMTLSEVQCSLSHKKIEPKDIPIEFEIVIDLLKSADAA